MPDTRHYFCLTPLYAKDHNHVPVHQAIWKSMPEKDLQRKLHKIQPGLPPPLNLLSSTPPQEVHLMIKGKHWKG